MSKKKNPGKLIVLEGLDGSGKKTQVELLAKKLKKEGFSVATVDFPAYHQTFFGKLVSAYLRGDFSGKNLNPYLTSLLYAGDRFELRDKIIKWLHLGKIVLANRYVLSNLVYQGAKIKREDSRKRFFKFCVELEYKIYQMPKENKIIFLEVPPEISQALIFKKGIRKYLDLKKPKLDIHEKDLSYLHNVETIYHNFAKSLQNMATVSCFKDDKLLSKEEISEKIFKIVKRVLRWNR